MSVLQHYRDGCEYLDGIFLSSRVSDGGCVRRPGPADFLERK